MHFRIEIEEDILLEKLLDEKDLPRVICINCEKDLKLKGKTKVEKGFLKLRMQQISF